MRVARLVHRSLAVWILGVLLVSELGAAEAGRVILLGFDGADARTLAELMDARPDDYPNLRRLRDEGTFRPLAIEAPAESAASWSALHSGRNPGETGVAGFIRRRLRAFGGPIGETGHFHVDAQPPEAFEDVPIPTWDAPVLGGAFGGLSFVAVLLVGLWITKRRWLIVLPIAITCGGASYLLGHTLRGYLPESFPRRSNPMVARNVWGIAAEAGKRCVAIDPAMAFDQRTPPGAKVLAGLGLPDARGDNGAWFLFTTDPRVESRAPEGDPTPSGGTVYRLDQEEPGGRVFRSRIEGPRNFWKEQKLQARIDRLDLDLLNQELSLSESLNLAKRLDLAKRELERVQEERTSVELVITKETGRARVTIDGQTQVVREGGWSDFFDVTFALNPLIEVHAVTRVNLLLLDEPYLSLYVNVLDIDPRRPPFWQAISSPPGFAAELASHCGVYETYGWSTATMPYKDAAVQPETLLQEVEFTLGWRERVMFHALENEPWDLFCGVFSTTDRVQHMMYRFYDREHPRHDPQLSQRSVSFFGDEIPLAETIPAIYRQMDRLVGRVLDEIVREGDTLMVVSDHGFQPFRRQVHINNWLLQEGYLVAKEGFDKQAAEDLSFVDWTRTRVYGIGLGNLYLNLEGREADGIVPPASRRALLEELRSKLLTAVDPESGQRFCKDVYVVEDIHEGPFLGLEGDIILGLAGTYRISWPSTMGGLSVVTQNGADAIGPVCSDNESNWSGDHVSMALGDVAGVFFSNRRLSSGTIPRLLQIAPTVLNELGVAVPEVMDLGPLVLE